MLSLYHSDRDYVWVDSVSMKLLLNAFGSDPVYQPGTKFIDSVVSNWNAVRDDWYFLAAAPIESVSDNSQYVLPFFQSVSVSEELSQKISSLPAGKKVGLGISAPKQNELAVALCELRPDLEYHCLGAALHKLEGMEESRARRHFSSGSGFEWIHFLFKSPKRTANKIAGTLGEIIRIIADPNSREMFKQFSKICITIKGRVEKTDSA